MRAWVRPDALLLAGGGSGGALAPGAGARRSDALRWLAGRPVELLGYRAETERLLEPLRAWACARSGELERLGPRRARRPLRGAGRARAPARLRRGRSAASAPGAGAHGGDDGASATRAPGRRSSACSACWSIGCWRAASAAGARCARSRSPRDCSSGGGWRERVVFRQPLSDRERIWLALSLRLLLLPGAGRVAGAGRRALRACGGRAAGAAGRGPLMRHAPRACARPSPRCARWPGEDAAMRAVCVDPDSRVPERRVVLTPLPADRPRSDEGTADL